MSRDAAGERRHVIIVGGGFAGVGCVKRLARRRRRPGHADRPQQLPPVPAAALPGGDLPARVERHRVLAAQAVPRARERRREARRGRGARPGRRARSRSPTASASPATRSCWPPGRSRTSSAPPAPRSTRSRCTRSTTRRGCARGSSGSSRPPTAIPRCIDQGALTFVVVGGGPTGVELAGALADLIAETMTVEYHDLAVSAAQIHLVDLGHTLLGPFSDSAHDYAAKVLGRKGVRLHLGVAVTEVGAGHVSLADGRRSGRAASSGAAGSRPRRSPRPAGSRRGAAGGSTCGPTCPSPAPRRLRVGRHRQHPEPGRPHPPAARLGRAAERHRAADNVLADSAGKPRKSFHYHDKGIMAMIGRGAAIAEVGAHRHELHGAIAFSAWLGVHASLMTGVRNRIDAFVNWGSDYFSKARGPQVLDRPDAARIDWGEDAAPDRDPRRRDAPASEFMLHRGSWDQPPARPRRRRRSRG